MLLHPSFLPCCFTAFVAIRLALLLFIPVEPSSDSSWYFNRATELVEQGTYSEGGIPTAYWPVGYPAFLALLFTFTGPQLVAAQLANLLFAGCSFWLLLIFARTVLDDEVAARLSILLLTFYPNNAAYVPLIATETLYTCLLLLAGVLMVSRQSSLKLILTGIILGFATLIKTQTLLLAPLLLFTAFLGNWSWDTAKSAIARTVPACLLMLLVIAPWTYRNYVVFDRFVLVSTNGGMSLLAGNNSSVMGDYKHDYSETDPLFEQAEFSVADQVGADQRARQLAKDWIIENPGAFIGLMPKKFFRLWGPDGEAEWAYQAGTPWYERNSKWFRAIRVLNQFYYFVLLTAFAGAAWKLFRIRKSPLFYYGLVVMVYFTLISLVFSGQSRYHFPVMPFIIIYAAWTIIGILGLRKNVEPASLQQGTGQYSSGPSWQRTTEKEPHITDSMH